MKMPCQYYDSKNYFYVLPYNRYEEISFLKVKKNQNCFIRSNFDFIYTVKSSGYDQLKEYIFLTFFCNVKPWWNCFVKLFRPL